MSIILPKTILEIMDPGRLGGTTPPRGPQNRIKLIGTLVGEVSPTVIGLYGSMDDAMQAVDDIAMGNDDRFRSVRSFSRIETSEGTLLWDRNLGYNY
jgi:hypothetical protein